MKIILYILLVISIASCTNNKKAETSQAYAATPNGLADLQKSATKTPSTTSATSNLLTNPEHGQPGHDCAIAVGAPLNSKPTQAATKAAAPTINVSQPSSSAAVPLLNEKGQRLNPAHGQPGHKCEVAVGAPLT